MSITSLLTLISMLLLTAESQSRCARGVHILAVRETGAAQGFGLLANLTSAIERAVNDSTAEAIAYPATWYSPVYWVSEPLGVRALVRGIEAYSARCTGSRLVLLGYSQGAQVVKDALCGAGDGFPSLWSWKLGVNHHVKAAILMGDPSHTPRASYNYGSGLGHGVFWRTRNTNCASYAPLMRSYCDRGDVFCDRGHDPAVHSGYVRKYGDDAVGFVMRRLNSVAVLAGLDGE